MARRRTRALSRSRNAVILGSSPRSAAESAMREIVSGMEVSSESRPGATVSPAGGGLCAANDRLRHIVSAASRSREPK